MNQGSLYPGQGNLSTIHLVLNLIALPGNGGRVWCVFALSTVSNRVHETGTYPQTHLR